MACSTVTTGEGSSLLYSFDLYEVDFSSLWTLIPDVPDINFPLITFSNRVNGNVPVYGTQTGADLQSIYYPTFPNNMQLIVPNLSEFNAQVTNTTPSTISYLVSGLNDVFRSTGNISTQITYGIEIVVSASQLPAVELERAWDEAWERGLINPTTSIMYSYFNLMGLTYEMDIRKSEGTNLASFTAWLAAENVPPNIQSNLLSLDTQLTSGNAPWNTEYNYTNQGFDPYTISSVFFGIQNLKENPNWTCDNPYNLPEPWNKYKDTERPRLDALRSYGRLIIPDNITKVKSGTYEITAADLSGSNIAIFDIPYGFDVTDMVKSPYGQAFSPSLYKTVIYPGVGPTSEINELVPYQNPYDLSTSNCIMGLPAVVTVLPGPIGFSYTTVDVIGGGDPNQYFLNTVPLILPRGKSIIAFYVKDTNCGFINLHMYGPGSNAGNGTFALSIDLVLGSIGSNHYQSLLQTSVNTRLIYDDVVIEDVGLGWKKIYVHVTTEIDDLMLTTAQFDGQIALSKSLSLGWWNIGGPTIDGEYQMINEFGFTFGFGQIQFSSLYVLEVIVTEYYVPDPYIPLIEPNWSINTTVSSENWTFNNKDFGAVDAFDDHFTMKLIVPLSLKSNLKNNPSLGSKKITIKWIAKFIAITEYIYPYIASAFFNPLYPACDTGNTIKSKYVKGTGVTFDVESFAHGDVTIPQNLVNCKSDILEIYNNYYEYAKHYSRVVSYGDIINTHGRYLDTHGSEFFSTARQVLRPQEYVSSDNNDIEIVNLNAIVLAAETKHCSNDLLYNADTPANACSIEEVNIFKNTPVPMQKSSTSVSLNDKLKKLNGKICSILPPNFTVKK